MSRKYVNSCIDCGATTSASRCKACANKESAARRGKAVTAAWDADKAVRRSAQMKGNKNGIGNMGMTGKKHTQEWKDAMSARMKGRVLSEETIRKIFATRKYGEDHHSWKGGRIIEGHGYAKIRIDGRYRLEHHAVMEAKLNRPLLPHENVHHINGVRDDNRPENLELWSTSQPKGQRVFDKIAWAKEFLVQYETHHCPTCTCRQPAKDSA